MRKRCGKKEPRTAASDAKRRRYEPPRIKKIEILFDEVALAGCKSGGGGVMAASCLMGCAIDGS
jgi:hypothetical protein